MVSIQAIQMGLLTIKKFQCSPNNLLLEYLPETHPEMSCPRHQWNRGRTGHQCSSSVGLVALLLETVGSRVGD